MSTLYLATAPVPLAATLASLLEEGHTSANVFEADVIVVPKPFMKKWLRLWLARRHGIAINLRFSYLEQILWDMLRAVDPQTHAREPEFLGADTYRLLVLAVMLGEDDPRLANLHNYFKVDGDPQSRRSGRRVWQLADMLGNLIRDYEYHRQDALIQPWIKEKLVLQDTSQAEFEKSQSAVFDHIIRDPGGKRALLNEKAKRNFKTLPQYAMEVWDVGPRADSSRSTTLAPGTTIHIFGLAQVSLLHIHTLRWLGRFFDLRVYHHNPLVSRLPERLSAKSMAAVVAELKSTVSSAAANAARSGDELVRAWGGAGVESLWLMGELLKTHGKGSPAAGKKSWDAKLVSSESVDAPAKKAKTATVLQRLQQRLLKQQAPDDKLPQDPSLQIVGCPGVCREVEAVHLSILDNLQKNRSLRLTDIAVLVVDMNAHRPIIQAVFERPPARIAYNLLGSSAGGVSTYGHALLGFVDLALESFTRTAVFEVLLNPCFLARLGVDRAQALTWVHWAKELGIFQGWDGTEENSGAQPAAHYGWRLGLQRLRLGQFMESGGDGSGRPAPRFGNIMPFADLDSQDRIQLDAFSRAVEGLLPTLMRLRKSHGSGRAWADTLRQLMHAYLDIPEDRPEEAEVRDRLFAVLEELHQWDHLQNKLPLSLGIIRELLTDNLDALPGQHGDRSRGGVTIAPLQAIPPLPFKIVYVLGLGEAAFPGSNNLSSFDLRSHGRCSGDVRPAEGARFLLLETLLAGQDKIYLFYNNRDLQKDQVLSPAIPVVQLKRYLNEHILQDNYVPTDVALHDHDPWTQVPPAPPTHDVGLRVNEMDRLLSLEQARLLGKIRFNATQEKELDQHLRRRRPDFTLEKTAVAQAPIPFITVNELSRFLRNPAEAALKRHLHLRDEKDDDTPPDDEPFVSAFSSVSRITMQVLQGFIADATAGSLEDALAAWPQRFAQVYEEESLRCLVPSQGFGTADQAFLREQLQGRITGDLAKFLRKRDPSTFCGPVLLGESITPVGAKRRFPALMLDVPASGKSAASQARLSGSLPFVWDGADALHILVLTHKDSLDDVKILSHYLFEPVLFYLALTANAAASRTGPSSRDWLASRGLEVRVSCKQTLATYRYAFAADEAVEYLRRLSADFLEPSAFELLPFNVLITKGAHHEGLRNAYQLPDEELGDLAEGYARRLEEAIDLAAERDHAGRQRNALLDLAGVQVPGDAFDKIRRRFRLMDEGPAAERAGGASGDDEE